MPDINVRADNSGWATAASDLRASLVHSGLGLPIVERVLAAIARPFAAIERERGKIDDADLIWVLIAAQADIYRRAGRATA